MSTSGEPYFGRTAMDAHQPDEIVVATPHAGMVLAELGSTGTIGDANARLGLSKVLLRDPGKAAARFAEELRAGARLPSATGAGSGEMRASSEVEKVLAGLRIRFASRWRGWFPVLGKNRVVLGGEGSPYTTIRSVDIPEPTTPATFANLPSAGGRGLTIGLLDTPVAEHEDYADLLAPGTTRLAAPRPWPFRMGHATFLAGLLARYAPQARIDVRGVLGGPDATASAWDVAVALLDLVDAGADVVTMSIGCFTLDAQPPLVLSTAVGMVRDRALLVAASGNHGTQDGENGIFATTPIWPAALDGVVAVGGSTAAEASGSASLRPATALAPFTPATPWVRLLAPGEDLVSTYVEGPVSLPPRDEPDAPEYTELFSGYATWSGSSMSTAIAVGCLASAAASRLDDLPDSTHGARQVAVRMALRDALQGRDPAGVVVPFAGPYAS